MKLPAVKFRKVSKDHVRALQELVVLYLQEQEKDLARQTSVNFFSAIQQAALIMELFLLLRAKIESRSQKLSLSFTCQQAATLLFACCHNFKPGANDYNTLVAMTFINEIDQQLKSINLVRVPSANLFQAHLRIMNN